MCEDDGDGVIVFVTAAVFNMDTHLVVPCVVHMDVGCGGCGRCWLVCHGLPPEASQSRSESPPSRRIDEGGSP